MFINSAMLNQLKSLWVKSPASCFAIVASTIYGLGFIIWNQYLIPFGFFEYNLLQVRFFGAGLLFIFCITHGTILIFAIINLFSQSYQGWKDNQHIVFGWIFIILIFVTIFFGLFQFVFELVPQWLGGARPMPTTMLGSEEQIRRLGDLGIPLVNNGEGKKSIQTGMVCLIYQNDRYILFQSTNQAENVIKIRNVPLSRDQFIGFSSVEADLSAEGCSTL